MCRALTFLRHCPANDRGHLLLGCLLIKTSLDRLQDGFAMGSPFGDDQPAVWSARNGVDVGERLGDVVGLGKLAFNK